MEYDIALLTLETEFYIGSYVQPIEMPAAQEIFDGKFCTVSGWGKISEGV